ncbi:MAG: hypothetical protein V1729_04440 [Candidatus Woesearchaeota archaeon]
MDEEEKKTIIAEIETKRKELDTLKIRLSELNSEKESWFEKKRKASKDISDLFQSLREVKGKRNTFTKQVKDSKQRRQELNTLLNQKRMEMNRLQEEKHEITKRFGIRIDPSKIKQEIEEIEFKIETEAMPFSVEQRMMRMINEKKKFLNQSQEASDVFDKIHQLKKELDKIRLKADETHKKVQTKAEASQQFHEELVESSKESKELKVKEDEALKKFVEAKTKYNEQNELVKVKLNEINTLRAKVGDVVQEEKKKQKKADDRKLHDQKQSVEEKIKKGLKLTTDDLLAFQAKESSSSRSSKGNRPGRQDKGSEDEPEDTE